jgi:hypothetical protein
MENIEIWKKVVGYENFYEVSNLGNVRSIERKITQNRNGKNIERILKPKERRKAHNGNGYLFVPLTNGIERKNKYIHRIVADAFLLKNGENLIVDHKDSDRSNNNLSNLQWITQRENTSKSNKNTSSIFTGVCFVKRTGKWKASIRIKSKPIFLGYFNCELPAARAYNLKLKEIL